MEWIQPSRPTAHVHGKRARRRSGKGSKKGKGMGTDGFDGYLVRLLPQDMQRRYWTILREIVGRQAYPKEWNEWIAILAMKPGEDPKTLERRRDLWLQCHSMKCVMRMILPAYERAVEAYLKARVRLGMRGKLTQGGRKLQGPLAEARWRMTEGQRREAGPMLWEDTNSGPWEGTKGCTYSRRLAAAGIATWEDVTDEHTRELKTWAQTGRGCSCSAAGCRSCDKAAAPIGTRHRLSPQPVQMQIETVNTLQLGAGGAGCGVRKRLQRPGGRESAWQRQTRWPFGTHTDDKAGGLPGSRRENAPKTRRVDTTHL